MPDTPSMVDDKSLRDKRALVTGASRGIGRAIADELAEAGADVALTARNEKGLRETAAQITERGRASAVVPADLSEPDAPERIVEATTEELGGLDILVNNAGMPAPWKAAEELTREHWDGLLEVNLKAPYFLAREAASELEDGGVIVNIVSVAGLEGTHRMMPYSVSKAGLVQMTRDLATEWAERGIRVNAVAPGWTSTEMTEGVRSNPQIRDELEASIPMGRFGEPTEIAPLVRVLASHEASYTTGAVFLADGGESI